MCIAVDCGKTLPCGHVVCSECAAKVQCIRCHRALRAARFRGGSNVCHACTARAAGQRGRGRPFDVVDIPETAAGKSSDFLVLARDRTLAITRTLENHLSEKGLVSFS